MISKDQATPLHEQVADDIRQRVGSGEFAVGSKLPSLRALRDTYGVAQVTVHTAIRELQREGILVSSSGRGTFVAARPGDTHERRDEIDRLRDDMEAISQRVGRLERLVDGRDTASD